MSTYYQLEVETLDQALEYCAEYQELRPRAVVRGQSDASWPLRANAFRDGQSNPFSLIDQLVEWWGYQEDTPALSPGQIWQVGQEYADRGFRTDLLDFTRSPMIAAYFSLGAPGTADWRLPKRAALFVIDPIDFDRIPNLVKQAKPPLPVSLGEILCRYTDMYWDNRINGLHRLQRQQGVFVRDPNGTLEATTDGSMSILPLAYEDAFGHPPFLKKVAFSPRLTDLSALEAARITNDKLFPLPKQLERLIQRFIEDSQSKQVVYF